jgi:hypothetical protein
LLCLLQLSQPLSTKLGLRSLAPGRFDEEEYEEEDDQEATTEEEIPQI